VALIVDIADAVAAALNGTGFSQIFTAQRAYVPTFDLKDMKELHVTVVPRSVEMTAAARGFEITDLQIDVAVQKKLSTTTTTDLAEIDALLGLVQEIAEFVRTTRQFGVASWVRTENVPIYSPQHLAEWGQFTSVLTLFLKAVVA
jgi:hypothetical protein